MSTIVPNFAATARSVSDAVAQVPDDAWDGPGLGEWTLRDLVGHTSRSLVTVIDYFARPVAEEVVPSASAYYVAIKAGTFDAAAVTERGRQAGRDLGDDPASRFLALADEAVRVAESTDPDLVVHTIVGGMRVAAYLPTRTFELCVHGLDIAAATGISVESASAGGGGGLHARRGRRRSAWPRPRPAAGDDGPARPAPGFQRGLTLTAG
jgi:uncharacterized protein (TIGR03083 family)